MKRKIVEIHVDELSLVDDAANREEFVLIKNKDGKVNKNDGGNGSGANADASGGTQQTKEDPPGGTVDPNADQPANPGDDQTNNAPPKTDKLPLHQALVNEMLGAIAEISKQIWSLAPTLDITDPDQMEAMWDKMWGIREIMYNLGCYTDVMRFAKAAKDKAASGDMAGSLDAVAGMLRKFSEAPAAQTVSGDVSGDKPAHPIGEVVQAKMIDQGMITRLVEGLMFITEALQGVDAGSLSAMLQTLMGQGTEQETDDESGEEYKAGKEKQQTELAKMRKELEQAKQQVAKLKAEKAQRTGEIQPSNGLHTEGSTKPKAQDSGKPWPSDLNDMR